jgi:hypothetical protein
MWTSIEFIIRTFDCCCFDFTHVEDLTVNYVPGEPQTFIANNDGTQRTSTAVSAHDMPDWASVESYEKKKINQLKIRKTIETII